MDPVQLLIGIFALISIAAGVTGYFKANVSKATVELYKEDNAALRLRIDTLEKDAVRTTERLRALEAARNTLLDVVTQATQIQELHELMTKIAGKIGVRDDD